MKKKGFVEKHPLIAVGGAALLYYKRGGIMEKLAQASRDAALARAEAEAQAARNAAVMAERKVLIEEQKAAGAVASRELALEQAGTTESEWQEQKKASDDYWAEHNRKAAEIQAELARKKAEDAAAMAVETARLHAEYEAKQQEKKGAKARGRYE